MADRVMLPVLALISLAISTVLVTSFAAIEMDEPVYAPMEEATSASESQSPQGASKERAESKGKAQPAPAAISPQETDRAPRTEDVEPLGEPMLAFYRAQKLIAA